MYSNGFLPTFMDELTPAGVQNCWLMADFSGKYPTTFPYLKVQRNITLGEMVGSKYIFRIMCNNAIQVLKFSCFEPSHIYYFVSLLQCFLSEMLPSIIVLIKFVINMNVVKLSIQQNVVFLLLYRVMQRNSLKSFTYHLLSPIC